EVEEAQLRQQRMRTAGSMDAVVARAGRGDEIDLRHHHATAVLLAKEDHAGHEMVEIGRSEGAGPAHRRLRIIPRAHEIDVGLAVDLPAPQEEGADPTLADQIEDFHAAVGEAVVPTGSEDGQAYRRLVALLRSEERRG